MDLDSKSNTGEGRSAGQTGSYKCGAGDPLTVLSSSWFYTISLRALSWKYICMSFDLSLVSCHSIDLVESYGTGTILLMNMIFLKYHISNNFMIRGLQLPPNGRLRQFRCAGAQCL